MLTTIFSLMSLIANSLAVGDWRPVGQGDPLIDPTNVYSPPQVAHVHYWLKAPSFDLEPPPTRATDLSQVAGWPQISSHFQPIQQADDLSTTPLSFTTEFWLTSQTPPPALSSFPAWENPYATLTHSLPTQQPKTSIPVFQPLPDAPTTQPSPTILDATTLSVSPRPTVQIHPISSTHPPPPPVSFVIEGHSKVKTYGPLPETSDSIHSINHNHLISTKKQTIFDLFNL